MEVKHIINGQMLGNYHTHTTLCHHAEGEMEAYVEQAIRQGLKELGFSDHVPMPFVSKPSHRSNFRMDMKETEQYVRRVLDLKKAYQNDITLYLGYEAEYYPKEFEAMLSHLVQYPIDYLILGQHFICNEYDATYSGSPEYEVMKQYVDQVCVAMSTGVYSYFAHPDLPSYQGEHYDELARKLIRQAKATNTPLEYNLLGMATNRFYPHDRFWELVKEEGASVVVGCDAHQVEAVANKTVLSQCFKKLDSFGLVPLETITLKKVSV